ncbi:MAG: GDP-mannose 4,6-dehydratase [Phycisphaerales bacterium]
MPETVLITGGAGFIGSHAATRLAARGSRVVVLDNFCDFYDPAIKRARAERLVKLNVVVREGDIRDSGVVRALHEEFRPDAVVHIAAMAGVRPSIENPKLYAEVNVDGTVNMLDAAASFGVKRLVFASSSSVYGNNEKVPFSEDDPVDEPISPYAATKRACELLCHTYWALHKLPVFCMRFFTVYGPSQRPDLAISKFMRMIDAGEEIPYFGDGTSSRDYTYIDDIVDGLMAALERCDRFRIYNLGGSSPVTLTQLVEAIEKVVGKKARLDRRPAQAGDVERTFADLTRSRAELGYEPHVALGEGLRRQWEARKG